MIFIGTSSIFLFVGMLLFFFFSWDMIHDYRWYMVGTYVILLLVYDSDEIKNIVKWFWMLWDCAPQVVAGILDDDHPTKKNIGFEWF